MSTLAGITYVHSYQMMQKGIDDSGPFYNVEYLIDDWSNADAFCNALMGVTSGTPHTHPLSANLYCRSAVAEGVGKPVLGASGLPSYASGAIIKAMYRLPQFNYETSIDQNLQIDPSDPILWCTMELDYGEEVQTYPSNRMKWYSDAIISETNYRKPIGVTTMQLTFHRITTMPIARVRTCRGKVNSTTFLGSPKGCVVFDGARVTVKHSKTTFSGSNELSVTMAFRDRDEEWNKFFRPDKGIYDYLETPDLSATRTYKEADLRALITFP